MQWFMFPHFGRKRRSASSSPRDGAQEPHGQDARAAVGIAT